MAVPVINYTPETGWEFGGAAQAYIKLFSPRTSVIQIGGAYSLNRQWYVNAQGTLYFGTVLPWLLQFRAGFRNYPDTYYSAAFLEDSFYDALPADAELFSFDNGDLIYHEKKYGFDVRGRAD